METKQLVHTLTGHKLGVSSVAFSPDGTLLASGSWDGTVLLWDMSGYGRSIASIAIEPSTAQLAAGQTQQFDVSALDADGLTVKISNVAVTWAVDGNIGSVDENGLFTAKVVGNGKLKATLKTDAKIAAQTGTITVEELTPNIPNTVEVSAAKTTLIADGTQTTTITVSVKDAGGHPVIGAFVAIGANLGSLTYPVTDNKDGTYAATYTAGKKIGTAIVTATAMSNRRSGNVRITLVPGPASTVEIAAEPTELPANGSSLSTITITVKDKNDNPIEDALVEMKASRGNITSPAEYQSNPKPDGRSVGEPLPSGDYTATYTAGTEAGEVTITATATGDGDEKVSGEVKLTLTEGPTLICAPDSGTVGESVKLTGSNFDANEKAGKLLMGSESVKIYAVGDTVVNGDEIYADEKGEFVVSFVIPKRPGGAVKLAVGDATTTLEIKGKINVSPESGRAGASVSLTGDGFGKSEKIKINLGDTKSIKEVDSNADGSFETSFQVDVQEPGEKQIVATGASSNISATETFTLEPSVPNSVEVSASETTLVADDTEKTTIIVSVKDSGGRAVIGANVTLKTDLGSVTSPATDNKDGTYSTTYTAAKKIGKATVTATAGGKSGGVEITLISGPASTVEIVAVPNELYTDGKSQSTFTITVKDKYGNSIEDALVEMQASQGKVTSPAEHQKDGDYTATYTAGLTEGKVTITATASGQGYSVDGKTEITLTPPPEVSLTLEPTKGPVGTKVKVRGEGFESNAEIGKLTINGVETPVFGVGETVVMNDNIWAGGDGTFVATFSVGAQPGGGVIVAVGEGKARLVIETRIFSVSPESGPAGTAIKVEGDGFGGEEPISVDFGDTKEIVTGKTRGDGSFEISFEADAQEAGIKEIWVTGFSERTARANFELISSEPATLKIETDPKEIIADGVSTAKLTITVKDEHGYGVSGQNLTVTLSSGKVITAEHQGGGLYLATYTSDTKARKVAISAETENGKTDQTEITLKAGSPETVTVEANPDSLSADGSSQATIIATVKDTYDNLCTDEIVTMELSGVGGTLSNDSGESGEKVRSDSQSDGTYTAIYTAANEKGTAVIKATTQNGKEAQTEISLSKDPNFVFSCQEPNQKAQPGKLLVYLIDGIGQNEFNLPMELSTKGLPEGVQAEFNPTIAEPTTPEPKVKIRLALSVPETIEQGVHDFTVIGMNLENGVVRYLNLNFNVQKIEADIFIIVTPKEIPLGESVKVSGKVLLPEGEEPTGLEVELSYQLSDGEAIKRIVRIEGTEREFFDEFFPDKIGAWKVKASWEGDSKYQRSEMDSEFQVVKGFSAITLVSSNASPKLGDTVNITGELIPGLVGERISLRVEKPNGVAADIEDINTEGPGAFQHEILLDQKGEWAFKVVWEGNESYEPSSSDRLIIDVIKEWGRVIIVLGGGNESTNPAWSTFNGVANRVVYKAFKKRRFTDDDIYFLSPSLKPDERVDVATSELELERAITQWAYKSVNAYIPLYIYLLSHNLGENFLLEDKEDEQVFLTPRKLNEWLDKLEAKRGTQVFLIFEACHSGKFITATEDGKPILPRWDEQQRRIIIASAHEDEQARLHGGNFSSFSKYFFEQIERNADLREAFVETEQRLKTIRHHSAQLPQIDANGDGVANDPARDYPEVAGIYIPDNIVSLPAIPEISQISPKQLLEEGNTSANIFVKVLGADITGVYGTVIPPDFNASKSIGSWDELAFDELVFLHEGEGKYTASYDKFTNPGEYHIIVSAENPDGTSDPVQTIVVVQGEMAGHPWDVNDDGAVDISDLVLVGSDFGKSGANIKGDVNGDGEVNINDLILVGKYFGEVY